MTKRTKRPLHDGSVRAVAGELSRRAIRLFWTGLDSQDQPSLMGVVMRTFQGMEDYYRSMAAEKEAKDAQRWQTVEGSPSWPNELHFAVIGERDFRIIHDPAGEHVLLPEAADSHGDWWVLIVRARRQEYLHLGAYHTVSQAMQAAARLWGGPTPD